MKIVREREFFFERDVLRFNARERDTLKRAAQIADDARALLRKHLSEDDADGLDLDTALAHIAIGVEETIDGVALDWWKARF